ncbi:MAG: sterol desaturase family protein [Balneolaceae bacterium]|nr:sterol desaturase family protein [Balneolaceae bacterium]
MKEMEIKNEGQGRMFRNEFLEMLTKAPAPVSASLYTAISLGMVWVAWQRGVAESMGTALGVVLFAFFFWTFFEYVFHRYVNHLDEYFPGSELAHRIAHTLHGIHHEYPRDRERLMMPPVPGLIVIALLYGGFRLAMGDWVYLFMPGFMTGYMIYAYIHICVHRSKVPSVLKTQYRHHAIHHYKHPDKAYGVSTTFWDRVFGTMPSE